MSAFLGPIHYWLFNKIQLVENRAMAVASYMSNNGMADAANAKISEYGDKLTGADLAELVGDNSIHNFLYGLIAKTEIFEAGLVEAAGEGKFEEILKVVERHGRETGVKALAERGQKADNPETLYQYIADHQLEGMPCDPGGEVELGPEKQLLYMHSACNHIQNWEYTNAPVVRMCAVHNAWLKGFIAGLNGSASYSVQSTIANGATSCRAEVRL